MALTAAPAMLSIRNASLFDTANLVALEQKCFTADRISMRSFKRFIAEKRSDLLLVQRAEQVVGYFLLIYRRGTSLARLYSLAVDPDCRKQGIAEFMLLHAEQVAAKRRCVLLRLEVRYDNAAAIRLYQKLNYHEFAVKHDFYEDHSDAICMQKQIIQFDTDSVQRQVPYIAQTTPFTCGPACLLMAFNYFEPGKYDPVSLEIDIWREATTIFMTSGHGGCGPRGLALAAHSRGFAVEIYLNKEGPLFTDSVRSEVKKAILQRVHDSYRYKVEQSGIVLHRAEPGISKIKQILQDGALLLALISTWQFDKSKAPHWVVVCAVDEHFVYINDPDTDDIPWLSATERQYIPVEHSVFIKAFSYGKNRLKAAVAIRAAEN
ncbi:MAG: peptidase C39 family protein [Gammaproteobacteria bacterium]|nr:peptidase C39 family protein [Gammaproteobacteria bacterium]MBU1556595.1 peptidase C39 family protein [Gammaproteobacteria bacterium]MBU2071108.1 peptidase C39 family protein [Gammaproteobacteria bacterium]MBU2183304.1 peptidase C39 family protein [Gammaproteobacteria bacterium]MBU2203167.1 peptidase C39 family protein [Gammaproteobacteria bacterium]